MLTSVCGPSRYFVAGTGVLAGRGGEGVESTPAPELTVLEECLESKLVAGPWRGHLFCHALCFLCFAHCNGGWQHRAAFVLRFR